MYREQYGEGENRVSITLYTKSDSRDRSENFIFLSKYIPEIYNYLSN